MCSVRNDSRLAAHTYAIQLVAQCDVQLRPSIFNDQLKNKTNYLPLIFLFFPGRLPRNPWRRPSRPREGARVQRGLRRLRRGRPRRRRRGHPVVLDPAWSGRGAWRRRRRAGGRRGARGEDQEVAAAGAAKDNQGDAGQVHRGGGGDAGAVEHPGQPGERAAAGKAALGRRLPVQRRLSLFLQCAPGGVFPQVCPSGRRRRHPAPPPSAPLHRRGIGRRAGRRSGLAVRQDGQGGEEALVGRGLPLSAAVGLARDGTHPPPAIGEAVGRATFHILGSGGCGLLLAAIRCKSLLPSPSAQPEWRRRRRPRRRRRRRRRWWRRRRVAKQHLPRQRPLKPGDRDREPTAAAAAAVRQPVRLPLGGRLRAATATAATAPHLNCRGHG